ncbi:ferrous iron transport protein B [Leptospira kobayashii]|uniref:Ferrous iron transport protein B n=1 Tax=Leptospira kobayashii TaxID=1917830 RepID=A0ABN6KI32_9LEPT|nr:ferrous iron transport protein B [Leptospira kobayashii]BDA79742.1 ferrous iron transport protein B [Leptospira kobayashii]
MSQSPIYLVGNPNCGKTTLFNQLTGLRQKTGNFSGVTVERKSGKIFREEKNLEIVDLPGTFGPGGGSKDKRITYDILLERTEDTKAIYVLDALHLERGLQFLLQVMDMRVPILVVLTMKDVLEKKNIKPDIALLERILGLRIFLVNAKSGDGLEGLEKAIFDPGSFRIQKRLWTWGKKEESFFLKAKEHLGIQNNTGEFFLSQALKVLCKEPSLKESLYLDSFPQETKVWLEEEIKKTNYLFTYQEEIIQKSFYIKSIVTRVLTFTYKEDFLWEKKADSVLLHPIFGFVFFFAIMGILFQTLFSWAEYPMELIESGIQWTQTNVSLYLPDGPLKSLFVDGILGGVGSVVVFVPQIALLFTFLGLLEESGYLARASFLMDKLMGRFGLSGRSFIPLLSSAACAVPAIMGTRTIENKSDRFTTIMVSPLVMCSARYPVYILIVGTIFAFPPLLGLINIQGLVLFGMFLLGLLTSLTAGLVFRKTVFKEDSSYFIMELPHYMWPSYKSIANSVYQKVKAFLQSAGQIILYISVVLWFLSTFPASYEKEEWKTSPIEDSYIGSLGKTIEPVLVPMGFDWKIGISILTSFAAREVMVSTLAVLYGTEDSEESEGLRESLRKERRKDGSKLWTPLTGISLLLFFAFASQCMSTLAVVRNETDSLLWPTVQFLYMTGLAVLSSTLVYQLGKALGFV